MGEYDASVGMSTRFHRSKAPKVDNDIVTWKYINIHSTNANISFVLLISAHELFDFQLQVISSHTLVKTATNERTSAHNERKNE